MDTFIQAIQLILSLSLLVVIHELGHFMFAKLFGARVEKFYLFFNPWFSICKIKRGETEYGLGWVPFGGYVKISGMVDESMDKEQMKQEPQPYEFRSKPAWQRLLIMVGGVVMNVILAIAIYTGISYTYGESYIANSDIKYGYAYSPVAKKMGFKDGDKVINIGGKEVRRYNDVIAMVLFDDAQFVEVERDGKTARITIDKSIFPELINQKEPFIELRIPMSIDSVLNDSPAHKAGLLKGDKIVGIDSTEVMFFDHFKTIISKNAGDTVVLSINRDNQIIERSILIGSDSLIGVYPSMLSIKELYPITSNKFTLLESIPNGVKLAVNQVDNYIKNLKLLFEPETEAYKSVGSVISMASMFDSSWNWLHFWSMTAFLSIILAVMNILPIPALDGGHVLFLLYEVITRRKLSDKFMEYMQTIGMILLLTLMAFAMGNDIYKLFQ